MVTVTYSTDGTTFTDISQYVISVSWKKSYGVKQNAANLVVDPDLFGTVISQVSTGDEIKITMNGQQRFHGMVSSYKRDESNLKEAKITALDASMDLFANQVSISESSTTASSIIVNKVLEYQGNKSPISATLDSSGGYITTTTQTIEYYCVGKRFYDVLLELSLPENTDGENQYVFYVDNNNELHFEPKGTNSTSLKKSDMISFSDDIKLDDSFNHVVVNCGKDSSGNTIVATKIDIDAYIRMGRIASRYIDESGIADKIKAENPGISDENLKTKAIEMGDQKAKTFLQTYGKVKKGIQVKLHGTFTYEPAMKISSIDIQGLSKDVFVVRTVKQNYDKRGWTTELTLEEWQE